MTTDLVGTLAEETAEAATVEAAVKETAAGTEAVLETVEVEGMETEAEMSDERIVAISEQTVEKDPDEIKRALLAAKAAEARKKKDVEELRRQLILAEQKERQKRQHELETGVFSVGYGRVIANSERFVTVRFVKPVKVGEDEKGRSKYRYDDQFLEKFASPVFLDSQFFPSTVWRPVQDISCIEQGEQFALTGRVYRVWSVPIVAWNPATKVKQGIGQHLVICPDGSIPDVIVEEDEDQEVQLSRSVGTPTNVVRVSRKRVSGNEGQATVYRDRAGRDMRGNGNSVRKLGIVDREVQRPAVRNFRPQGNQRPVRQNIPTEKSDGTGVPAVASSATTMVPVPATNVPATTTAATPVEAPKSGVHSAVCGVVKNSTIPRTWFVLFDVPQSISGRTLTGVVVKWTDVKFSLKEEDRVVLDLKWEPSTNPNAKLPVRWWTENVHCERPAVASSEVAAQPEIQKAAVVPIRPMPVARPVVKPTPSQPTEPKRARVAVVGGTYAIADLDVAYQGVGQVFISSPHGLEVRDEIDVTLLPVTRKPGVQPRWNAATVELVMMPAKVSLAHDSDAGTWLLLDKPFGGLYRVFVPEEKANGLNLGMRVEVKADRSRADPNASWLIARAIRILGQPRQVEESAAIDATPVAHQEPAVECVAMPVVRQEMAPADVANNGHEVVAEADGIASLRSQ